MNVLNKWSLMAKRGGREAVWLGIVLYCIVFIRPFLIHM
jgi:hypothetical protein